MSRIESSGKINHTPALVHLRVDQVGSLLRPPELKAAYESFQQNRIDADALRECQDTSIRDLVAAQEAHGLSVLVDGEFRRNQFMESFSDVAGFDTWSDRLAAARKSRALAVEQGRVAGPSIMTLTPATEPLRLRQNLPLQEYQFAQSLTDRPVKASLIGPDRIFQTYDEVGSRNVYADAWQFIDAVCDVQRQMVGELIDSGCQYVHMDAPGFTAYVDESRIQAMHDRGLDHRKVMTRTIAAENAVIEPYLDRATFGIHLCRGNEQSHWHREGSYDAIAEQLFNDLKHHRLLLEYDTPRAGSFAPLRFVPKDKMVVLGLITTKDGRLESVDELRARIEDATRFIDAAQLAVSPQCGFASTMEGNNLTVEEQWAKLARMEEVAALVWD